MKKFLPSHYICFQVSWPLKGSFTFMRPEWWQVRVGESGHQTFTILEQVEEDTNGGYSDKFV